MNPVEISEAVSDLALEPFDRAEFPFQFLAAFDNKPTTIQRLRSGNSNASDVQGGVLQAKNIHIATCAPGEVDATLTALRDSPKTAKAKAQFILATDGETFQAEDLSDGETVSCAYKDFPEHFGFFLPLAGITTVPQIRENAFDVKATGRLNKLYLQLLKENPDWAKADRQHDMNHFMARLIFCFFAEDTDIFPGKSLFTGTVETMSARDSSDTHSVIGEIFRAMDTAHAKREGAGLPPYAIKFPYVNGQLFSGSTEVPTFSKVARTYLLHVGNLPWQKINPDIFGSMIQAVTDDAERGSLGMHYTSVPNILKVLNPLFLDDVRAKLDEAGDNGRKLLNLRNRMARIRVFDPACGSGNFLVIAYKEMRDIEARINARRGEPDRRSDIPLTNFRGIEIREFPAEIARLSLIIAEYQSDVLYRGQREALVDFLPLSAENWITCGNALRLDWLSICPPTGTGVKVTADDLFRTPLDQSEIDFENEGGETYICGNPPYLGGKKQNESQKSDMAAVFGSNFAYKNLDYICAFFEKASKILPHVKRVALVTTSSVNQGSHVPTLWPRLLKRGLSIDFAYSPFKWANNANRNAGVFVSIVGFSGAREAPPVLFAGDVKRIVDNINCYLIPGAHVIVDKESKPISPLARIITGNAAYDEQHLRIDEGERDLILKADPRAIQIVRRSVGTSELLNGERSWCLWISDAERDWAERIPLIGRKIESVRRYRESGGDVARSLVQKPHQFRFRNVAHVEQIVVPQVCSADSGHLLADLLPADRVITHLAHVMFDPELWNFALVVSRVHFLWATTLSGRHGNGLRYGSNLCWNTFPLPKLTAQNKADLARCAGNILLAREAHFPKSLAELYEVKAGQSQMPDDLRRAHEASDELLERIYIGRRFKNDTERLEKLFELYAKMTSPKAMAH